MSEAEDAAELIRKWRVITSISPYSRELGLELHKVEPDWCVIKVNPGASVVGNRTTGVVHGGVVTALLDSCYGLAIFVRLNVLRAMATLDLRIDYLKGATPGREIFGGAVCYKLGHELAFVRGAAYHDSPDEPIATSSAIFMFTDGPVIPLDEALARMKGNAP